MRNKPKKILILFSFFFFLNANAQTVTTLAGSGNQGFADGTGTAAQFYFPHRVVVTADETLYVTDTYNTCIRKITASGVVTTFAGSTNFGTADGTGTAAQFWHPIGLTLANDGNFYVTDYHRIRKITPDGVVTTVAGSSFGYTNGAAASAHFSQPTGIAVASDGTIYVADTGNSVIRKISPAGIVSTFAGSSGGFADGTGTSARFNNPADIALAADGTLYVTDGANFRIRKITPSGVVTTFAGSGIYGNADGNGTVAQFHDCSGLIVTSDGTLYVVDRGNNRIRKITNTGVVTTVAGAGYQGFADGPANVATFFLPDGVALSTSGNLYVSDNYNNRIRKITGALGTANYHQNQVSVYPNPASSIINVELGNLTAAKVILFDMNGRALQAENIIDNRNALDISDLADGIYLMQITTEKGMVCKKILKR